MELRAITVAVMMIVIIYNFISYEPVDSPTFGNGAPSLKSIILFWVAIILFIYSLYLNENPIYL